MVGLLEPRKHMGVRRPLVPWPRPGIFSTIFAGETNTN